MFGETLAQSTWEIPRLTARQYIGLDLRFYCNKKNALIPESLCL
jgi:hypothetical protein